jgi:hypothetical protein
MLGFIIRLLFLRSLIENEIVTSAFSEYLGGERIIRAYLRWLLCKDAII